MIARLAAVVAAAVPWFAAPAYAGPLADALARGDDGAIATLRKQPDDPAARCTLGAIYARRDELARAGFYLEACGEATLPEDIAPAIDEIARETLRKLKAGDLVKIQVWSTPSGVSAETDALPGEQLTTPATLWVRPGRYELRAAVNGTVRITFVAEPRKDGVVVIPVPAEKAPAAPKEQTVHFDDEPLDDPQTAPPPPNKYKSIVPKRYRGAAALNEDDDGSAGGGGPELVDPLAVRAAPRPPRAHWLGARLAGGMFDDGRAGARPGLGLAATGRYALSTRPSGGPAAFLAARLDWSRRGGAPDLSGMETGSGSTIDVLGAGAGAGLTVLDRGSLSLALIGQLRADLRLASARAGEPVRRAGIGAAAGAELALPGTPITCGLRFEHGLTELVAGARDRAILLEIGVDWR